MIKIITSTNNGVLVVLNAGHISNIGSIVRLCDFILTGAVFFAQDKEQTYLDLFLEIFN